MKEGLSIDQVEELVRAEYGKNISEIDLKEVTRDAPHKIAGLRFFISSYQFNLDPTPVDSWVLVDEKDLREGEELSAIFEEKDIMPKTKEEAIKLGRLIVFAEGGGKISSISANKTEDGFEVLIETSSASINYAASGMEYAIEIADGRYDMDKKGIMA